MIEHAQLSKSATGIDGLDAITEGGLPAGRPTLLRRRDSLSPKRRAMMSVKPPGANATTNRIGLSG